MGVLRFQLANWSDVHAPVGYMARWDGDAVDIQNVMFWLREEGMLTSELYDRDILIEMSVWRPDRQITYYYCPRTLDEALRIKLRWND